MTIPHQYAADQYIIELGTRYTRDVVDQIVREAERAAEQSGSLELTVPHLAATETQYNLTRQKSS